MGWRVKRVREIYSLFYWAAGALLSYVLENISVNHSFSSMQDLHTFFIIYLKYILQIIKIMFLFSLFSAVLVLNHGRYSSCYFNFII